MLGGAAQRERSSAQRKANDEARRNSHTRAVQPYDSERQRRRRQSDGEYARALAKRVENVGLLAAAFADTCFAEQFAVAYPHQPCASRPWAREWD